MADPAGTTDSVALSREDRSILALETATVAGHICLIAIVEPGMNPTILRDSMLERLALLPSLQRRLAVLDGQQVWSPDPHFDVDAHVVNGVEPATISKPDFEVRVAELFAERLDRARPLWRIDVLGPLVDGQLAVVWRLHHSLADGITAMHYAQALLWDAPEGKASKAESLITSAHTSETAHHQHRRHLAGFILREFDPGPGHSPFDGHIGSRRAVAFSSVNLDELKTAAHTVAQATLNDAVLSCVAGGLRRWIEDRHGNLRSLRVKVPVSLHVHGDDAANRDSYFCMGLPIADPDPARRLKLIRAETRLRKERHDAEEVDRLVAAFAQLSPRLRAFSEKLQTSPRQFALNVSNVPGPAAPVTMQTRPVVQLHTLADIRQRHALRVAITSVTSQLSFGLCVDPALVDDVAQLSADISQEATELVALASNSR